MTTFISAILEYKNFPGYYYCDSQLGYTTDLFVAEMYTSVKEAEEARSRLKNREDLIVREIWIK